MKTILHVDMNCFFPSVEEILNPKLKNKPVVVGGRTKRSVVASANYEARRYGIKAAMPLYRASILCPKAIIVEPHFREYERYHNLFINLLKEKITDKIEVASIDECYIDITSLIKKQSAKSIAIKIQNLLKSKLNLGSSIGIGHNRFMSKMGSNYKKPLGITQMFNEDLISKIWPLKIENMYMVGPATAKVLYDNEIKTIRDLALSNKNKLKEIFGNSWEKFYLNANGKDDDELIYGRTKPKSISSAHTFENDTNNYDEIKEMILLEAKEVWENLSKQKLEGKTINLTIKTPDFISKIKSKSMNNKLTFELFFSNLLDIYEKNFIDVTIRLIGVGISKIF